MDKDNIKIKSEPVDDPVVIPDECGDSIWDKVLEQSSFVQAIRLGSKSEPVDIKAAEVKK